MRRVRQLVVAFAAATLALAGCGDDDDFIDQDLDQDTTIPDEEPDPP